MSLSHAPVRELKPNLTATASAGAAVKAYYCITYMYMCFLLFNRDCCHFQAHTERTEDARYNLVRVTAQ